MDLETVEQIVALLSEYPVSEITVEQDGQRICVRRAMAAAPMHSPAEPPAPAAGPVRELPLVAPDASPVRDGDDEGLVLSAPMVGLFHHAIPPVRYGAVVSEGEVVGNIESMKLMNEVRAEVGGRVIEVLVEDGAPVEYGQPLFRLGAA